MTLACFSFDEARLVSQQGFDVVKPVSFIFIVQVLHFSFLFWIYCELIVATGYAKWHSSCRCAPHGVVVAGYNHQMHIQ